MTGQIINDGVETFTPIMTRILDIGKEFAIYLIYIGVGYIGICLIRSAVKYIIRYLDKKSIESIRPMEGYQTYHADIRLFNKEDVQQIEDYSYDYQWTKPRSDTREGLVHEHNTLVKHLEPGERSGIDTGIGRYEVEIDYKNKKIKSTNPRTDDERDMEDNEEKKLFKDYLQDEYRLYRDSRGQGGEYYKEY